MRNIINQIRWAYQRVVRGYDDRIFWGFDAYFADIFIPPLKQFCKEYLNGELNPARQDIFDEMIRLIEVWESDEWDEEALGQVADHFSKHIGWFWD